MLTRVLDENRGLAVIFFKEGVAVVSEFDETIDTFYATLATMITTFNEILHARGLIAPMNFRLLAYATIGQVERIISEHLVNQAFGPLDLRELVDHLVMLFLDGTRTAISAPSQED